MHAMTLLRGAAAEGTCFHRVLHAMLRHAESEKISNRGTWDVHCRMDAACTSSSTPCTAGHRQCWARHADAVWRLCRGVKVASQQPLQRQNLGSCACLLLAHQAKHGKIDSSWAEGGRRNMRHISHHISATNVGYYSIKSWKWDHPFPGCWRVKSLFSFSLLFVEN